MAGREEDREALRAQYSSMSIKALKEALTARRIHVPPNTLEKSELVNLLLDHPTATDFSSEPGEVSLCKDRCQEHALTQSYGPAKLASGKGSGLQGKGLSESVFVILGVPDTPDHFACVLKAEKLRASAGRNKMWSIVCISGGAMRYGGPETVCGPVLVARLSWLKGMP
jgi:hypothetical protein